MRKKDVRVGGVYEVKVSGRVQPVRIRAEHWTGKGWEGINILTGRDIRVPTAARLRCPVVEDMSDYQLRHIYRA